MLVFTCLAGETVYIGDNIKMKILSNIKGRVQIGWDAPKEIVIDRESVREIKMKRKELEEKYGLDPEFGGEVRERKSRHISHDDEFNDADFGGEG